VEDARPIGDIVKIDAVKIKDHLDSVLLTTAE